ncbi:Upstream activation factor subunit spp27 [Porphyridium purpureum]|uniref:Upstream activation factor subunit spp27 n=1 Tax=Porphyridium purpureum TaxID=35688 RepID=A0A5J4Z492_PORPP|nr:Upstream activation factor subunit spp27 [Porphyridium purpureum]|eukprot:POR6377..scf295_1
MVSDEQLCVEVREIVRTHDLETLTIRRVLAILQERHGVHEIDDARKPAIRGMVNLAIQDEESQEENGSQEEHDGAQEDTAEESDAARPQGKLAASAKASAQKNRAAPHAEKRKKAPRKSSVITSLSAFKLPVVLAPPLAEFLQARVMARSDVSQRIVKYAKEHNLQDPNDGRNYMCDAALKRLLQTDSFTYFSINKLTAPMMSRAREHPDAAVREEARILEERLLKEANEARAAETQDEDGFSDDESRLRMKKKKARSGPDNRGNAFKAPYEISDQLAAVCGSNTLSRPEVVRRLWAYIKSNELQDPSNRRHIICDAKLRAVFNGLDIVTGFNMNKYLSQHFIRRLDVDEAVAAASPSDVPTRSPHAAEGMDVVQLTSDDETSSDG